MNATKINSKTVPTKADIDAMIPALRALAATTPFGLPCVVQSGATDPDVSVALPTPGNGQIYVNAHIAYGSASVWGWQATVSSTSLYFSTPDEVRTAAAVLNVAHAIAALLASATIVPLSR